MKSFQFTILLTVSLLLIAFPVFGKNPHPHDDPAINFQGRIEVGEIGYSGFSKFTFAIGPEGFGSEYWSSWAETTCVEGIYNIILGRDTDATLDDTVFNHPNSSYYLRVAFSTDGSHFETLSPDQEIVTVPFAVNADLLDGLESPSSAFVGVTDVQTIYDKTLMDTHYFAFSEDLPDPAARGYFAWDSDNDQMVYHDGSNWVSWGEGSVTSPWTRTGTTLSPKTAGDVVALGDGTLGNPIISIGDEINTGIYQGGDGEISFTTLGTNKFAFRNTNVFWMQVTAADPSGGAPGALYYNSTADSFKYHDASSWKDIASGSGSIMSPIGSDCTLRGSDGTTWVATTGLLIDDAGTCTVQKNIIIKEKMQFFDDSDTYIQGPVQNILDFYTNGSRALTIDDTQRFNLRASGTAPLPAFTIGSDTDTGIWHSATDTLAFATGGITRMRIRTHGQVNFQPLGDPPTGTTNEGDFYYDTDQDSFMYCKYDGGGWHPIASGSGSIMSPIGSDCTLRGSDGTTWVATTGLLIDDAGTCTVQKNIIIKEKMQFFDDSDTYIQGPVQNILDFYTNGSRALTIDDTQRFNLRASGTAPLPAFAIGSDTDTGIWHSATDTLAFATGGITRMSIRTHGQVNFQPLGTEPDGTTREGDFYYDTDQDSFMYCKSDGGVWYPIASGTGSIEEPDAVYDTVFATDGSTWWPNKELRIYPGNKVATWNDLQVGRSTAIDPKIFFGTAATTYITSPSAGILNFYTAGVQRLSLDASGNLVFNDTGIVANARFEGNTDEYLLYLNANENGFAVGTDNVANYKATIQQTAGEGGLLLDQDGAGDGLTILQDGAGNSIEITHAATANAPAIAITNADGEESIYIDQNADTDSGDPSATQGGAIHVNNNGNLYSAITAYGEPSGTQLGSLVNFKVGGANFEQPVVKITGSSANANHLWLYPQASAGATTNEGELYASSATHALMYYNGADWIALTGAGGEGGSPGGSDTWVQFNDGGSFGGEDTFTYDSDNNCLTVSQITTGSGATITEFSTDTTLGDSSDSAVPTERAVKLYVDDAVAGGGGEWATQSLDNLSNVAINASLIPDTDDTYDLGSTGAEWRALWVDQSANIDELYADTADIDGGTIDDVTITSSTIGLGGAAAGKFTNLTATTAYLEAGVTITEFSIDTTLGGGDDEVPTELAVKTYVNDAILDGTGTFASGTGADTYLTYWINQTTISGEAAYVYDDATDEVTLTSGVD